MEAAENKISEKELSAAREAMTALVEALLETRRRLHAEMAEREKAENELLKSRRVPPRNILDLSGDAIFVRRLLDGRYLDVNEKFLELTGYSRHEIIGNSPAALAALTRYQSEFNESLYSSGAVSDRDGFIQRKDGSAVAVATSALLVEIANALCVIGIIRPAADIHPAVKN